MKHRRKGPPRRVMAYKYAVEPIGEIPAAVWEQQRRQMALWNALVSQFRTASKEAAALNGDKAAANALWSRTRDAYRGLRDTAIAQGLYWSFARQTLDNFDTALQQHRTVDRHHFSERDEIRAVMLAHRYCAPVSCIDSLFHDRAKRVHFDSRACNAEGRFWLGGKDDNVIRMRVKFDHQFNRRPVPDELILKRISFCGRKHQVLGWTWWIVIVGDVTAPAQREGATAIVTLGMSEAWVTALRTAPIRLSLGADQSRTRQRRTRSRRHRPDSRWQQSCLPTDWDGIVDALRREEDAGTPDPGLWRALWRELECYKRRRLHLYGCIAAGLSKQYAHITIVRPTTLATGSAYAPRQLETAIRRRMAATGGTVTISQIDGVPEQIEELRESAKHERRDAVDYAALFGPAAVLVQPG